VLQDMVKVGRRLNLAILEGLSPGELSVADRAMTVMRGNLRKALAGRA
jgi:hypothetical protein